METSSFVNTEEKKSFRTWDFSAFVKAWVPSSLFRTPMFSLPEVLEFTYFQKAFGCSLMFPAISLSASSLLFLRAAVALFLFSLYSWYLSAVLLCRYFFHAVFLSLIFLVTSCVNHFGFFVFPLLISGTCVLTSLFMMSVILVQVCSVSISPSSVFQSICSRSSLILV